MRTSQRCRVQFAHWIISLIHAFTIGPLPHIQYTQGTIHRSMSDVRSTPAVCPLLWRARYTDVRRMSSESFEFPCQSSVSRHNSVRDERPTWSRTSNFSFFQATETFSSRCEQALSFRGRRVVHQGEPRVAPLSICRLSSFNRGEHWCECEHDSEVYTFK
jgi:hypothetical protein